MSVLNLGSDVSLSVLGFDELETLDFELVQCFFYGVKVVRDNVVNAVGEDDGVLHGIDCTCTCTGQHFVRR